MAGSRTSLLLPGGPHAALLLHGLAGSPLEVRFVGKLMQRAGFSVSIPVIEGYSMGSTSPQWHGWLDEVDRLYQALRAEYRTVSVAGLSVGATLALALAARHRDLQAIALWGVTLYYDGWAIPPYYWILRPLYALGLGRHFAYREKHPYGLKNEKWRGRVAEAMRRNEVSSAGPAVLPADFLYQSMLLGAHAEEALARVHADTLVMHAADDETASPRNAHLVFDSIASLHKRKIMLGDSYHIITMDNERDLVARETIRFFQHGILSRHPQENIRLVSSARALLRLQRQRAQPPRAAE